jgi:hypothetical protein
LLHYIASIKLITYFFFFKKSMSSSNAAAPEATTTETAAAPAPTPSGQPKNHDNIFANAFHNIVKVITPVPDDGKATKETNEDSTKKNNPVDAVKDKITDVFGKFVDAITPVPDCTAITTETETSTTETSESKPKQPEDNNDENGEKNPFVNAFHKLIEVITPVPDDDVVARLRSGANQVVDDDAILEGVGIPKYLDDALNVVTPNQRQLVITLYTQYGQEHLFQKKYFNTKSPPSMRRQLAQQLESLDKEYVDGGLAGCIKNVRTLLLNSKNNVNPLDGWKPTLDTTSAGKAFQLGTPEYQEMEAKGLPELGAVGFVLVAGGLGERLGYSGIKVRWVWFLCA